MEPTGTETETILEALRSVVSALNRRADLTGEMLTEIQRHVEAHGGEFGAIRESFTESFATIDKGFHALGERLNVVEEHLGRRINTFDRQLAAVGQRFDAVGQRFDAVDRRFDAIDRRFDANDERFGRLEQRIDDVHVLILTVKEAAELQSARVDALSDRVEKLDIRLTGRTDHIERRMDRGFARTDERFAELKAEMRAGFADIGRGRRRGPKRDD